MLFLGANLELFIFIQFDLHLSPFTLHAKNCDTLIPNILFQSVILLYDYFLLEIYHKFNRVYANLTSHDEYRNFS